MYSLELIKHVQTVINTHRQTHTHAHVIPKHTDIHVIPKLTNIHVLSKHRHIYVIWKNTGIHVIQEHTAICFIPKHRLTHVFYQNRGIHVILKHTQTNMLYLNTHILAVPKTHKYSHGHTFNSKTPHIWNTKWR